MVLTSSILLCKLLPVVLVKTNLLQPLETTSSLDYTEVATRVIIYLKSNFFIQVMFRPMAVMLIASMSLANFLISPNVKAVNVTSSLLFSLLNFGALNNYAFFQCRYLNTFIIA